MLRHLPMRNPTAGLVQLKRLNNPRNDAIGTRAIRIEIRGQAQVVRKDLVRMLNVPMKDVGSVLQQCGVGSAKVLAKDNAATPADLPSSRT